MIPHASHKCNNNTQTVAYLQKKFSPNTPIIVASSSTNQLPKHTRDKALLLFEDPMSSSGLLATTNKSLTHKRAWGVQKS